MELAIVNLSGDLAHPDMLGMLHANDPNLEVEIEIVALDDQWFDDVVAEVVYEAPRKRRWLDWLRKLA